MKKKFTILLYLLILLCTCSIGFATWVFTNDHFFGANYAPQAEFNFNDQKATYDGTTHTIKYPSKDVEDLIKLNYNSQVVNPITGGVVDSTQTVELYDAGEYNVKFTPKTEYVGTYEEINIKYTIDKRTLGLSYGIKENKQGGQVLPSKDNAKDMVFELEDNGFKYLPNVVPNNVISGDTCTISYKNSNVELGIPDSKTYVIDSCSNSNYQLPANPTFSITIKKLKTHLSIINKVIEVDFDPAKPLDWNAAKSKIISSLTFKKTGDVDTNTIPNPFFLNVDYMHNGYYSYGSGAPSGLVAGPSRVAGSTYKVKISTGNNDNYILDDSYIVFKYKTVLVDADKDKNETYELGYMTIEDALNKGGRLKLAGDSTNSTSHIITSFSKIDVNNLQVDSVDKTVAVKGGTWLHIPFEDSTHRYTPKDHTRNGTSVYSALVIPNGVTVNVQSGGQVLVCGQIADNGDVCTHGVVINDGIVNISGGTWESYGYTKGTGEINATNKTTVSDVFKMYNYPGGRNSAGMKDVLFPLSVYSFHNISCKLKVDGTSGFIAFYRQTASKIKAEGYVTVLGTDNLFNKGQNGLFHLTNANQYIIKTVENVTVQNGVVKIDYDFNHSIAASNQKQSQREVLEIHGDFNDNSMTIKIGTGLIAQTISTSKEIALPIGYMRIHLMKDDAGNGINGTLKNNSYNMLPGSEIVVDEGCTLNINNGINMIVNDENYKEDFVYINNGATQNPATSNFSYKYFHDEWFKQTDKTKIGSQVTVNGTLNVLGGFGGKINTEVENATIDFSKGKGGSITILKQIEYGGITSDVYTKKFSDNLKLKIYSKNGVGKNYQSVTKGKYSSVAYRKGSEAVDIGWIATGEASIEYQSFDGKKIPPRIINISKDGYNLMAEDLPEGLVRPHYTFDGWYFSTDYRPENKAEIGTTIYAGAVLYAHWIPVEYNIEYVYCDENGNVIDKPSINNNPTSFNIETNIGLLDPTSEDNSLFGGWFNSIDLGLINKIIVIDGSKLVGSLDANNKVTIYGQWWPSDTKKYVVNYDSNNTEYPKEMYTKQEVLVGIKEITSYNIQDMYKNDDVLGKTKYFIGWKLADTPDTEIINVLREEYFVDGAVSLVGVWGTKFSIEVVTVPNQPSIITAYVKPGTKFTVPEIGPGHVPPSLLDPTGKFIGWKVTNGLLDTHVVHSGEQITLSDIDGEKITLTAEYKYEFTITINDAFDRYTQVIYEELQSDGKSITRVKDKTSGKIVVKYKQKISITIYDKRLNWGNWCTLTVDYGNGVVETFDNNKVEGGAYREVVSAHEVTDDIKITVKGR